MIMATLGSGEVFSILGSWLYDDHNGDDNVTKRNARRPMSNQSSGGTGTSMGVDSHGNAKLSVRMISPKRVSDALFERYGENS